MQYTVDLSTLMDAFAPNGHQGFSDADIQAAEDLIGARLPENYRAFLRQYGRDPVNDLCHHINCPPKEIVPSYSLIHDMLEDWSPEFLAAVEHDAEEEYRGNGYFALWRLPEEQWNTLTDNHVLIWYENQGVWNAGYRLADLQAGLSDPPVYITTEDDLITFAPYADGLESFLAHMLYYAAYETDDCQRMTDPCLIDAAFAQAGIDRSRLVRRNDLAVCMDDPGRTLYFHSERGDDQVLLIARPGQV